MKPRIAVLVPVVFLGLGCLAIAFLATVLVRNRYYYAADQQRSSFLIAYNPGNAIAPFVDKSNSHETGSGVSAGAGTRFTTHALEFDEYFTARKQDNAAITTAVENDLERKLLLSGAHIISSEKGADNVLHISYSAGQVIGSIALAPLTANLLVHRASNTLPVGSEDVTLHVAIEEKWFPHGIPSAQELAQINR
jgi:hypothetical protein